MNQLALPSLLCTLFCTALLVPAQGTKADYERAANLRKEAKDKLRKGWIDARWLPDGNRFWYTNNLANNGVEFIFVDAETGTREVAFDSAKLAAALSKSVGQEITPTALALEALEITKKDLVHFASDGRSYTFSRKTGQLAQRDEKLPKALKSRKPDGPRAPSPRAQQVSPDRAWKIEIVEGDVIAIRQNGGKRIALTEGEELLRVRVYWAPDSQRFALLHTIPGENHIVHVVESSPRDQVQPKLKSWRYTKPGDRIGVTKVRLFNLAAKRESKLENKLFATPWHIDRLRWDADSSRFTFLYNQRGHQVMRIVAIDGESGEASTLIEDTPDTFFNYFQKLFVWFLDESSEIIWMSERDGWNHLYLFDAKTGKLKNQITSGEWLVRGVDRIDPEKKQIWFRAGGIDPGQDPYHVHYCRINFDGSGLLRLTEGDGTHNLRFSPDRRFFIDHYSRIDLAPVHELRRTEDGSLICKLEEADTSELEAIPGWLLPERFVAKGRDGKTDIWGVIHRPSNFDPKKRYPIVEKIYAGPHGHYVPKKFYSFLTAMDIAELGFIVVVIDGMGTNWRSKKFHDLCWQNLKDAGFPDRILWIKAAAKKYPSFDTSRVGIYGGSAGGQNALGGLLFHPDFYKVAVADCGCHDNRMDKIHWNEAWMGLMGPHYADNSNVTHAHKLEGKLFLTVGELDTNVDPASTMQVVDALIKANKDFDLALVPGAGHGVGETPYLRRRRQDFFVRHLYGLEPRRE